MMGPLISRRSVPRPGRGTGRTRDNYFPIWEGRVRSADHSNSPPRTPPRNDANQHEHGVKKVDLLIEQNEKAHRTEEYEHEQGDTRLVLRRGQPFNLAIEFDRDYDPKKDDLRLIFEAGDNPMRNKGTRVEVLLSDADEAKKWGAKIVSHQGADLKVTVFTPPTLYVGIWTLSINRIEKHDDSVKVFRYEHQDPIIFIFNPWCKDDAVYMGDENQLNEYVMNEQGRIYTGSAASISSRPWVFGQFDSDILDCALYLLKSLKWPARGQPIAVVRKLTAMVNSSDDNGVLTGNWSGNYRGGVSPSKWTGTPPIIEQYWNTKRPVRYGQCWVFSGVTTTLMRTLGIPARSVTNFKSAHDTDGSITIDYNFDANGRPQDSSDSIWNFHVWNEVWMSRDDLPPGYGGWQACDATPQEASDGIYVCGPTSVQAIKQGNVNLPFDAPFVYAEVNADIVYWLADGIGGMEAVDLKSDSIGKFISTKAPGFDSREDVTLCYKAKEGSVQERVSVMRANQTGPNAAEGVYHHTQEENKDVSFIVEQDSKNTWVGQDFVVKLRIINNNGGHSRSIKGQTTVKTMYYTGVTIDTLFSGDFKTTVEANKEHTQEVVIKTQDYVKHLRDGCMFDVTFFAYVFETGQKLTFKEDYRLRKPHLTIKAPKEVVKGEEFKAQVSFVNPLPLPLTDCELSVGGLAKQLIFPQGQVGSKGTFQATIPIIATKVGRKEMVIIFSSSQLDNINAPHPIVVKPN